jgi:hypothetical protein
MVFSLAEGWSLPVSLLGGVYKQAKEMSVASSMAALIA